MKIEVTRERVLEAANSCPDAKNVLKKLFPEVFVDSVNDRTIKPYEMTRLSDSVFVYLNPHKVKEILDQCISNDRMVVVVFRDGVPHDIRCYCNELMYGGSEKRVAKLKVVE